MPEITPFGWFHTLVAIAAILLGIYLFVTQKVIRSSNKQGLLYLLLTAVAAGTSLAIYRHGGFGVAHLLGVMTLVAILVGLVAERSNLFGGFSRLLQTAAYSGTFLFNMLPAIAETLLRLPPGDPFITSLEAPLLRGFHLAFFVLYLIGLRWQMVWQSRNPE